MNEYIVDESKTKVSDSFLLPFQRIFVNLKGNDPTRLINCIYEYLLYNSADFYVQLKGQQVDCVYITGAFYKPNTICSQEEFIEYHHNAYRDDLNITFAEARNNYQTKLMVIGKAPGIRESELKIAFCGDVAREFLKFILEEVNDFDLIYTTNFCRVFFKDFDINQRGLDAYKWALAKDTFHILANEIALLRPEYIIYTQAGTLNRLLGKFLNCEPILNEVIEGTIPAVFRKNEQLTFEETDEIVFPKQTVKVLRTQFKFDNLIKKSVKLLFNKNDTDVKFSVIRSANDLQKILNNVIHDCKYVAIDAEWYGKHYINSNSFIRTIQLAFSDTEAYILEIHDEAGNKVFVDFEQACQLLNDFIFKNKNIYVVGAFFYTDAIWLKYCGLDVYDLYQEPLRIIDIALCQRAIDEEAKLGLCEIVRNFDKVPRWDIELEQWASENQTEFYGHAPAEILFPYAAKDVCYALRILPKILEKLKKDEFGLDCTASAIISTQVSAALSEMMDVGIAFDNETFNQWKEDFKRKYDEILQETRELVKWPDFNPRKPDHKIELLFGEKFVKTRQRPKDAISLDLDPVISTQDANKNWCELKDLEKKIFRPSTNKLVCGILSSRSKNTVVKNLYYLSIIDQTLKTIFGKKSLLFYRHSDLRLRSFFSPTLKTGRISSSKPNLQNLSKRRDDDLSRILGKQIHIRDLLIPTEGYVIITVDIVSAELYAAAVMAQDDLLLEHCIRSSLNENDPDYYDIHSALAVEAFKLTDCKPTKKDFVEKGYNHLRVAAKSIVYGANYGRSNDAILKEIESQGVFVTIDEIETLRVSFYKKYRKLKELLDWLIELPTVKKWTRTYFGRTKRFNNTENKFIIKELGRQCANFHFQATVADAMSLILYNIWKHPAKHDLKYRLLLSIHDELWIETPEKNYEETFKIVKECVDKVKFPSWDEEGKERPNSSYYSFLIDHSVKRRI